MKAQSQAIQSSSYKVLIALYVWLRVTLSFCAIGAIVTALISAYAQETHLVLITLIMATFLAIGVYKAEFIRRHTGLNKYFQQLSTHKHRQY